MKLNYAWNEIFIARYTLYNAAMRRSGDEAAAREELMRLIEKECARCRKAENIVPAILAALPKVELFDYTDSLPDGIEEEMKQACIRGLAKTNSRRSVNRAAVLCGAFLCVGAAAIILLVHAAASAALDSLGALTDEPDFSVTEPPVTEPPVTEPPVTEPITEPVTEPEPEYAKCPDIIRTADFTGFDGEHGVAVNSEDRCGATTTAKDGSVYVVTVSGVDPARRRETYTLYKKTANSFAPLCSIERAYAMTQYGKYVPSVFVFCDKDSVPHVFLVFGTQMRCYAYDAAKGEAVLEGSVALKSQYTDLVACADDRGVYMADYQRCVYYDFEKERFSHKETRNNYLPYVTDIGLYGSSVLILGTSKYDDVVLYTVTNFSSGCELGEPIVIAEGVNAMPASCQMDVSKDGEVHIIYTDRSAKDTNKLMLAVMEKSGRIVTREIVDEKTGIFPHTNCDEVVCSPSGELYFFGYSTGSGLVVRRIYTDLSVKTTYCEEVYRAPVPYTNIGSVFVDHGDVPSVVLLYDTSQYAMTANTKTNYYYAQIYFY